MPLAIFAQAQDPVVDWDDLRERLPELMALFSGGVLVAMFIAGRLAKWWNVTRKWPKIILYSIVGFGLAWLGHWWNLGYLAGITWWETLLWGIGTGVAVNGVMEVELLRTLIMIIINYIKSKLNF